MIICMQEMHRLHHGYHSQSHIPQHLITTPSFPMTTGHPLTARQGLHQIRYASRYPDAVRQHAAAESPQMAVVWPHRVVPGSLPHGARHGARSVSTRSRMRSTQPGRMTAVDATDASGFGAETRGKMRMDAHADPPRQAVSTLSPVSRRLRAWSRCPLSTRL